MHTTPSWSQTGLWESLGYFPSPTDGSGKDEIYSETKKLIYHLESLNLGLGIAGWPLLKANPNNSTHSPLTSANENAGK